MLENDFKLLDLLKTKERWPFHIKKAKKKIKMPTQDLTKQDNKLFGPKEGLLWPKTAQC